MWCLSTQIRRWLVYQVFYLHVIRGVYLTFADFCRKFSVKSNFLIYFQVLWAIPKRLLEKCTVQCRNSFSTNPIFSPGNSTFHLSLPLLIDLHVSNLLLAFFEQEQTLHNWPYQGAMQPNSVHSLLSTIFKQINSISNQIQLKRIFAKVAHRIVTTKKEIHLCEIEDSKSCHCCEDDDSLLHSFLGCHTVTAVDFLQKVLHSSLMKMKTLPSH